MPGKMRATLNQFFTRHHDNEEAKLPRKIWAFLEKNNHLLFLRFRNCEPFEECPRGKSQMPPMLSSLIQPRWNSEVTFCRYIRYVIFYKVSFGGQNILARSVIGNRH